MIGLSLAAEGRDFVLLNLPHAGRQRLDRWRAHLPGPEPSLGPHLVLALPDCGDQFLDRCCDIFLAHGLPPAGPGGQ